MKMFSGAAIIFFAVALFSIHDALALTLDKTSAINTDGSARYTDPDDQPAPFMYGNQQQSNFLPNNDAPANFGGGSAAGAAYAPQRYRAR